MKEKFILLIFSLGLIFGFFAGYITRKNSEKSQYIERYKKDNDKFYRAIERQFDI